MKHKGRGIVRSIGVPTKSQEEGSPIPEDLSPTQNGSEVGSRGVSNSRNHLRVLYKRLPFLRKEVVVAGKKKVQDGNRSRAGW